jgi:hypothetical protein
MASRVSRFRLSGRYAPSAGMTMLVHAVVVAAKAATQ